MADEKKKPAGADIDDLKARLGLKKDGAPGAKPAGPGLPIPGVPGPAAPGHQPGPVMGPPPGLGGPAAAPPPAFLQQQQPKPVDVTKDPFGAAPVRQSFARPSLLGVHKAEEETVTAADQKAAQKRSMIFAIGIGVLALAMGFTLGTLLGSGCSQRQLRKLAVLDGNDLYGLVQNSTKKLSDMKRVLQAQQAKAATMDYDAASTVKLKEMTSKTNPPPIQLTDIARRNYMIYTGETVPTLFTYSDSWAQLYDLVRTHVAKSENDSDALKAWKGKITDLSQKNYGVIFQPMPFSEEKKIMAANLILVTQPFDPSVESYQIQFDEGTPVAEVLKPAPYVEGSGDLSAEPEKWIMPLGDMSKLRLEEKAKKRFESYQERLKDLLSLVDAMEKNQQLLVNELGTIAAEM